MPRLLWASRSLAAVLALVAVAEVGLFRTFIERSGGLLLAVLVLLFYGLLGTSVVGLWNARKLGFYALYALVPFSTIALAIPLIPFVTGIFPREVRPFGMLLLNLSILSVAIATDIAIRKQGPREAPA